MCFLQVFFKTAFSLKRSVFRLHKFIFGLKVIVFGERKKGFICILYPEKKGGSNNLSFALVLIFH